MPKSTPAVTRAQSTTEAIRAMIVRGELRPGMRLQAQRLADLLCVSRTPIADALAVLHKEGLLEYAPNCGYGVKQFEMRELLGAFDVRSVLEGLACRVVAEQGLSQTAEGVVAENLQHTEELLFSQGWSRKEQDAWQTLNLEFHDTIIGEADNSYLEAGVAHARVLPLAFDGGLRPIEEGKMYRLLEQRYCQQAYMDHTRIFEALLARQAGRAENMMKEHIFTNREASRRVLEKLLGTSSTTQAPIPAAA